MNIHTRTKRSYIFTHDTRGKKSDQASTEYVDANIQDFVRHLTRSTGRDIWLVGGGEIVSLLLNAGIVNEIILSIHPVILGRGITLMSSIHKQIKLKLENSQSFDSGLVQLCYRVINAITPS